MYQTGQDPKITELIARRRAKTEELRKKRRRQVLTISVVLVLAIALLAVAGVFVIHAISGRGSAPSDSQNTANAQPPQVIQADLPGNDAQPGGDSAPDAQPDSAAPDAPDAPDAEMQEPAQPDDAMGAAGRYSDTIIFVDPGRGYSDHGCTSDLLGGVWEYEINLAVARRVADALAAYGFTVALTHDTNDIPASEGEDYTLDQLSRVRMATAARCDLYLSLHCDNFPDNPSASGTRLYYCTDVDGSGAFADALSAALEAGMGAAPRISGRSEEESFIVTSQIPAPSVLVEMGFVTNAQDAQNLLSDDWRDQFAQALTGGVIAYFTDYLQED